MPGGCRFAEQQRRAALRVAAREQMRVAREAEMIGHREHVVGEAVPRVVRIVEGASLSPWPRKSNEHTRRPAATSRSATGAQMRPWKPVGCASSTGAPVAAPVVHGEA